MTGSFFLDWAVLAVSLFNTILLLWLGLTVLLNAERRRWGVWLAGGGLLMAGAFFVSHSALLGRSLDAIGPGMDFWWHVGWAPVVALPLAWYVVMLWYSGFWESAAAPHELRRRHRLWLVCMGALGVSLAGLLIFANPLPSFWQVAQLQLLAAPSIGGIPVLILAYPLYIVLCIGLSLDVLRHPGPSTRVMGELARQRARPWLMAASMMLLLVSLLVAWIMLWIVVSARQRITLSVYTSLSFTVAWFDLVIASLIAAAVILQGQAVIAYEVFTGKALPRRGFRRYWRNAVILAAGYSAVTGWSLVIQLRPIYTLLLTVVLITVFYALLAWRSFAERERAINNLRPFVASPRLYDHLLTQPGAALPDVDVAAPFRALCNDVLGARVAYLAAVGALAPLAGPALVYPQPGMALPSLSEITPQFDSPQKMCAPVDPDRYGGAMWAVPLWSERGLIGVLLLGPKRDGGLYTVEEIEIARASGERLIDAQASAEMARRLMALQRQRLAESQVLDRRARRVLHDDVLPRLHAAILTLSGHSNSASSEAVASLADAHRQISDLLREMPTAAAPEVSRLGVVGALRQAVQDELPDAFDDITWEVEPEAERQACSIPTLTAEVVFYAAREAVRNAARHARGAAEDMPLHLRVRAAWRDGLELLIEDDGVGLGVGGTSAESGGQGLALHSTMMAVVGGTLSIESVPGVYTRVLLSLPQRAEQER